MIPATHPRTVPAVAEIVYDQWTPVRLSGDRLGEGRFSMGVRLHRSRLLANGNTELSPDPADGLDVFVPDIYAAAGTHGDWWTAQVRAAVLTAAAGLIQATVTVGAARELL